MKGGTSNARSAISVLEQISIFPPILGAESTYLQGVIHDNDSSIPN